MPPALDELIQSLQKLPGIGPRTAERLAMHILKRGSDQADQLSHAVAQLHGNIAECKYCHHLSEGDTCNICLDDKRDDSLLAVVEDALDVVALERTSAFKGRYHVLGGIISPVDGIGPDQIKLQSLRERVETGEIQEIILATNPNVEGEATAHYIRRMLPDVSITRLARGLPMGSDLEYADDVTLSRALEGRQAL